MLAEQEHPMWSRVAGDEAGEAARTYGAGGQGLEVLRRADGTRPRADALPLAQIGADTGVAADREGAALMAAAVAEGEMDNALGTDHAFNRDGLVGRGAFTADDHPRTWSGRLAMEMATDPARAVLSGEGFGVAQRVVARRAAAAAGSQATMLSTITRLGQEQLGGAGGAGGAGEWLRRAQSIWPLGTAATRGTLWGRQCQGCPDRIRQVVREKLLASAGHLGAAGSATGQVGEARRREDRILEEVGGFEPLEDLQGEEARSNAHYATAASGCPTDGEDRIQAPEEGPGDGAMAESGRSARADWLRLSDSSPRLKGLTRADRARVERDLRSARRAIRIDAALAAYTASDAGMDQGQHLAGAAEATSGRLGECPNLLCELRLLVDAKELRMQQARAGAELALAGLRLQIHEGLAKLPVDVGASATLEEAGP